MSSWACPDGTVACSSKTSSNNTICVATSKKATDCPITEAKFVKHSAIADYKKNPAYTIQVVDEDYDFVTSKDIADALPLTKFRVES